MTKILVSHGFGAGWSTWNEKRNEVAEYKPIIDFLENGGNPSALDNENHPLIEQMKKDLDIDSFYTGSADGLTVEEVGDEYCIEECKGSESVRTTSGFW